MKSDECEKVQMEAMAVADGHSGTMETARIEAHIAGCKICRNQLEAFGVMGRLLDSQTRRQFHEELWASIEPRLQRHTECPGADRDFRMWAPIGLILLAYKLFEQIPDRNLALLYKLLPLLLVTAVFVLLRQNPFKINTGLKLEGE